MCPERAAGAIRGQLIEAVGDTPAGDLVDDEELPATGHNNTAFLLLAGAAFTVGGAIVYASRHSDPTH